MSLPGATTFFAITHPGFEDICQKEIQRLPDIDIVAQTKGGIEFESRLTGAYAAALQMRTAGRLLMRLAQFKVENFRASGASIERIAVGPLSAMGAHPPVPCLHAAVSSETFRCRC